MKLVREYIEFKKTHNPKRDMGLGMEGKIDMWMTEMGFDPDQYEINDDFTIDVYSDAVISNRDLKRLPDFIKFGKIGGGFYAGGNPWESLDGFPDVIMGDLQLRSPATPDHYKTKYFSDDEILKSIKIYGKIYN